MAKNPQQPDDSTGPTGPNSNAFEPFCEAVKAYADSFLDAVSRQVEGQVYAEEVSDSARTFQLQLLNVVGEMRMGYRRASAEIKEAVENFVRIAAGVQHAIASAKALKKGFMCNIIHLLQSHLKEIKKIIGKILQLLGLALLNWEAISAIIDELFDAIAGIFCPHAASKLSKGTQNYYLELAAIQKFGVAFRAAADSIDDESDK